MLLKAVMPAGKTGTEVKDITLEPVVSGGPLYLRTPIPVGSGLHPANIEECDKWIAHLEETKRLMTMPPKGKKSKANRNTLPELFS